MTKRNKIFVGWTAFLFVVFHSTCLFIYAFPRNIMPDKVHNLVEPYVSPLFDQTWAMFAPCPLVDGVMEFKLFSDTDSTDWLRPSDNTIYWHRLTRVTHYGDLAIMESNLVWWANYDRLVFNLDYGQSIPEEMIPDFKKGKSYLLVKRYVFGLARNLEFENITKAVVKCSLKNVETNESGVLVYPTFNWSN